MNPYCFTSLVNPQLQPDRREEKRNIRNVGLDHSMSCAFYRAVISIGQLSSRWTR